MGLFDANMDINTICINLINFGFDNNLISANTKDFMINELSVYTIMDDAFKVDLQNYLTNNNESLTDFENAFVGTFIIDNTRYSWCDFAGDAVGFGAGFLIGAVGGPIAGGVAGILFGNVAEEMCNQYNP